MQALDWMKPSAPARGAARATGEATVSPSYEFAGLPVPNMILCRIMALWFDRHITLEILCVRSVILEYFS